MNKEIVVKVVVILLGTAGSCWAGCCTKSLDSQCREKSEASPVEKILKQLNQKTTELESYQCRIEYLVRQPLFESQSLRKGALYYQSSSGKSALRINFQTLKQDDEKEQKYIEQYIFDGVWLTKIDYQIKQVTRQQLAEPNEAVNAFELAKRNFPVVGFTKVEDLKKEFEIKLIEQKEKQEKGFVQLYLKVKPDSVYKDDYTSIDFWIDKNIYLPAKIVAFSTEDDIYEIKLIKPKVNKKIDKKVFELKIPKGFTTEITPLQKK